ncbi:MAG: DUF4159 domain-containing protein [Candidatus Korobacteraceae bacterium]
MTARRILAALLVALTVAVLLSAAQNRRGQRRWAMYEHEMQDPVDDPPDAMQETEFAFGRLRYRSPYDRGAYAAWGIDANKADRQFIQGLRRLTRVEARSSEHIVDIDSDEIFDWPWIFVVSGGDWVLNDSQAARLRKYLERGGFLLIDDFHGEREWSRFMAGLAKVVPNGTVTDIPNDHPIFHVVYDLKERGPIPGANVVHGPGYERDGKVPYWRALADDKGRIQVAICFNMDVGDAWEFADDPNYPEAIASLGFRLGINYVLYAMTH